MNIVPKTVSTVVLALAGFNAHADIRCQSSKGEVEALYGWDRGIDHGGLKYFGQGFQTGDFYPTERGVFTYGEENQKTDGIVFDYWSDYNSTTKTGKGMLFQVRTTPQVTPSDISDADFSWYYTGTVRIVAPNVAARVLPLACVSIESMNQLLASRLAKSIRSSTYASADGSDCELSVRSKKSRDGYSDVAIALMRRGRTVAQFDSFQGSLESPWLWDGNRLPSTIAIGHWSNQHQRNVIAKLTVQITGTALRVEIQNDNGNPQSCTVNDWR